MGRRARAFGPRALGLERDLSGAPKRSAQEKKRLSKLGIDAARILSKVGPIKMHIEQLKSNDKYKDVPKEARQKMEKASTVIDRYHKAAEERMNGAIGGPIEPPMGAFERAL